MSDIVEKLAKILNQAENAATEQEADAFFRAAQTLSTKYSIGLAEARAHTAKSEKRENPVRETVDVSNFPRNTKKHVIQLFNGIARANEVKIDIAHNSTRIYPYGFPSDIELTRTLFAHIAMQMVEEANKYIAKGEYKSETSRTYVRRKVYSSWGWYYDRKTGKNYDWEEELVEKPVDGRVARSNFYSAFISRVTHRLNEAKDQAVAEAIAEPETTGTELVLADKAKEVHDYYKSTSNARGSWSGPSSSGHSSSSRAAGAAAGSRARLSGQGAFGAAKGALTS